MWITDHWKEITGAGTAIATAWAWFTGQFTRLRKGLRWVRKQRHLSTENADLTERLAASEQRAIAAEARAAESDTQRDVFAKKLQPPERRPEPQDRILQIAAALEPRLAGLKLTTLSYDCGFSHLDASVHLEELIGCGYLRRSGPPDYSMYLTHKGRDYLVRFGLPAAS